MDHSGYLCRHGYGDVSDMVGSGDMGTYYLCAVQFGEYYAGVVSHLYTNMYLYIQIYKQYEPIPKKKTPKISPNTITFEIAKLM